MEGFEISGFKLLLKKKKKKLQSLIATFSTALLHLIQRNVSAYAKSHHWLQEKTSAERMFTHNTTTTKILYFM
jgi:hypothetical protein